MSCKFDEWLNQETIVGNSSRDESRRRSIYEQEQRKIFKIKAYAELKKEPHLYYHIVANRSTASWIYVRARNADGKELKLSEIKENFDFLGRYCFQSEFKMLKWVNDMVDHNFEDTFCKKININTLEEIENSNDYRDVERVFQGSLGPINEANKRSIKRPIPSSSSLPSSILTSSSPSLPSSSSSSSTSATNTLKKFKYSYEINSDEDVMLPQAVINDNGHVEKHNWETAFTLLQIDNVPNENKNDFHDLLDNKLGLENGSDMIYLDIGTLKKLAALLKEIPKRKFLRACGLLNI